MNSYFIKSSSALMTRSERAKQGWGGSATPLTASTTLNNPPPSVRPSVPPPFAASPLTRSNWWWASTHVRYFTCTEPTETQPPASAEWRWGQSRLGFRMETTGQSVTKKAAAGWVRDAHEGIRRHGPVSTISSWAVWTAPPVPPSLSVHMQHNTQLQRRAYAD